MPFPNDTLITMTDDISPFIINLRSNKVEFFAKNIDIKKAYILRIAGLQRHTSFPSGKQRQKKSGRGLPTAFFIESVITAVTRKENKRPALTN